MKLEAKRLALSLVPVCLIGIELKSREIGIEPAVLENIMNFTDAVKRMEGIDQSISGMGAMGKERIDVFNVQE